MASQHPRASWPKILKNLPFRFKILPIRDRVVAARNPDHSLVAAFQPLLAESESELEQKAGEFFHTIKMSKLNRDVKEALEGVFLSWLGQRLPKRTKQEIEKMFVGELPELLETRMAQDILNIGEERGLITGRSACSRGDPCAVDTARANDRRS
jgi:hypothetical protein